MSWPAVAGLAVLAACAGSTPAMMTEKVVWGEFAGEAVHLYTLRNANGVTLKMTDFGAKIVELHVPDRHGKLADVVLGFDNLQQYIQPNQSIGSTVGRYSNRIRNGQFDIDGVTYQTTRNEGDNSLHGAGEFENVVWDARLTATDLGPGIEFRYRSPDGTHGFPGNLDVIATFVLTAENAVRIIFTATTDAPTQVNLTQHSYFNLNGAVATIHDHVAMIDADRYVVLNGLLPTGEIDTLTDNPLDLSTPTRLGDNLNAIPLGGYHHNYVANKAPGEWSQIAEVVDPESGRTLRVSTTQPGVVFYVAMGLTEDIVGKNGVRYGPYMAFCLETQGHIDAANHANFPSTLLRPGETYRESVEYAFGTDNRL